MKKYLSEISFIALTIMYLLSVDFGNLSPLNIAAFILIFVWIIVTIIKIRRLK